LSRAEKLDLIEEACKPGVKRAHWHGGPFTVIKYVYAPGSEFPEHSHDEDQVTVVVSGNIVFDVSGEKVELMPGETAYIPGGAPHSASVPKGGETVVSINVFHPPRKEHP